jgi:hypothetical protein
MGGRSGQERPRDTVCDTMSTVSAAARGEPTSLERMNWVIGLDDDAVRRNLLITLSYHELSSGLARVLGAENANWCTFATWASRTAGRFVRDDEVPALFRLLLGTFEPVHVTLARVNAALGRIHPGTAVLDGGLLDFSRDVVHNISELIAAGNLAVFGELAPLFSRAIDALERDPASTALDPLIATLAEGQSQRGGQSLLHGALRHYAAARAEPDPNRKAALMLFANGQVGLHEQIRLQPFIADSINAPIRDALDEQLDEWASTQTSHAAAREVRIVMSRLLHPLTDATERLWQTFTTHELMTLELPDGTLHLGEDIPALPGDPLYPAVLDPIDNKELIEFVDQYDADLPGGAGTAALDWAQLSNRMHYILALFRSRQCDPSIQGEPFTDGQREAILAGTRVPGKL